MSAPSRIASLDKARTPAKIDSKTYRNTFYGILNAQGDFWTPLAFGSVVAAEAHIRDFWIDRDRFSEAMRKFKIVPVRIQLTQIEEK